MRKSTAVAAFTAIAALTAGTFVVSPATATPPLPPATTYTITAGSTGPSPTGADAPATPYIDKDGTFYTQQATAQYGMYETHEWDFNSGVDIDSATPDTALNTAVDPANPQDRNDETTWRCNNSPTGLISTVSPGSSYVLGNYCDLIGTWVDPDTGNWVGLVHNEFTGGPFNDGMHYDSIDYAYSTNQGKTWKIAGHALTSPYSTVRGDNVAFPNQTYYFGDGDQRLFVDVASGYFYVYYSSMIVNKSGGYIRYEHVARAPMSGKMATGTWTKWYEGAWSKPGVGGLESNIVPVTSPSDTGYTAAANSWKPTNVGTGVQQIAAGLIPNDSPLLYMSVTYNAYLGLYFAEAKPVDRTDELKLPMPFYVTDDLSTQKWYKIGDSGNVKYGSYWYHWFIDSGSKTTNSIIGKKFREYCINNCPDGNAEYRNFTVESSTPATILNTDQSYQITGNGRALTAVTSGGSTTVSSVATGSAGDLAKWTFRSLNDGSYAIQNNATGLALGVPNAVSGRAWGTKPVLSADSAGSNVAQQWFVVPGRTVNSQVVAGSYRLVNRYSGLVIAMSSTTTRTAETTPVRAWTDTSGSSVGSGRTAVEQTLGLTAAGPAVPFNLAYGKTATASSDEGASYAASKAIDNDSSTYWAGGWPDGGLPQWWQVDLGAQYDLNRINITNYADGSRYYNYTVATSKDGNTWTTVATKSNTAVATTAGDNYSVASTGRYVRVTVTANSANTSAHLVNVLVDGLPANDLASGKTATAQSSEGSDFVAGKAVDGGATYSPGVLSYWGAGPLPQWWQVDLGSAYALSSINVTNYADGSRYYQYTIQGSTNGTTWTTLAQKTDNTVATWDGTTHAVSGVARYVRITVTLNSSNSSGHLANVTIR